MLDKVEKAYIKSVSKLQKYRINVAVTMLIITLIAIVIAIFNMNIANLIILCEIVMLILGGIVVKLIDFFSVI